MKTYVLSSPVGQVKHLQDTHKTAAKCQLTSLHQSWPCSTQFHTVAAVSTGFKLRLAANLQQTRHVGFLRHRVYLRTSHITIVYLLLNKIPSYCTNHNVPHNVSHPLACLDCLHALTCFCTSSILCYQRHHTEPLRVVNAYCSSHYGCDLCSLF